MKLSRAQFAEPGVLESLAAMAEACVGEPGLAAGAAWLAGELAALPSARRRRRDAALLELRRSFYAVGSVRQAARAIASALNRFDARRRRGVPPVDDDREQLLAVVIAESGGRVVGVETVRKAFGISVPYCGYPRNS